MESLVFLGTCQASVPSALFLAHPTLPQDAAALLEAYSQLFSSANRRYLHVARASEPRQ